MPPSSSILLRGATVLTLDTEATVLPSADVLVRDGRIERLDRGIERPEPGRVLDVAGCYLLPGLVQGHVHLGQTLFRGLAEDRRLLAWLRERIWPLEAAHDDESAYWSGLLGAAECLLGGTTTIQDIGIGPGFPGLLAAIRESGLRAYAGLCLMDEGDGLPPGLAGTTDRVLEQTEELGAALTSEGESARVRYALNPRFILSCSDALWSEVRALAEHRGWPVHTHALEQVEETARVRELKDGRDEIAYFAENGILGTDLRIAHGVGLGAEHLRAVSRCRFSVVHCPSSNLKLGSGIAPIVAVRAAGIPVGIGADGAPCNNDLDALEELRLAALLQKLDAGPDRFSGLDALRLATSEGARALGLEAEIGTVEVGKAADLLVLDGERPEMWAGDDADPHDLVTFGASRAAVRHVLVSGDLLVEDGRLTALDLVAIRRRADRALASLLSRARLPG
jgi:cytosine/adenosine deaminase-related metal-dependent hydrolase